MDLGSAERIQGWPSKSSRDGKPAIRHETSRLPIKLLVSTLRSLVREKLREPSFEHQADKATGNSRMYQSEPRKSRSKPTSLLHKFAKWPRVASGSAGTLAAKQPWLLHGHGDAWWPWVPGNPTTGRSTTASTYHGHVESDTHAPQRIAMHACVQEGKALWQVLAFMYLPTWPVQPICSHLAERKATK